MPDKNIGFSRTVYLDWLDAAAALRLKSDDPRVIRQQLDPVLAAHLHGKDARRKTIDVLLGFWDKSAAVSPPLHAAALRLYRGAYTSADHLWLHYGLGLLYYPIFRYVTATIGHLGRLNDALTRKQIKAQVAAEWGHLGALDRSVERICASLTEWGLFPPFNDSSRKEYRPVQRTLRAGTPELETWLLACALHAHPAESLPFSDLLRLPETFPFAFSVTGTHLARSDWFTRHREGGWEMISLAI